MNHRDSRSDHTGKDSKINPEKWKQKRERKREANPKKL